MSKPSRNRRCNERLTKVCFERLDLGNRGIRVEPANRHANVPRADRHSGPRRPS